MNSRAKEISLETLISIFNHPAADIHILLKEILRVFKEEQIGKPITADKQQARVVIARIEISIRMLEKIDLTKHKVNLKEIFDLLAGPSLFHTNYEARMGAVELIGQLFRHMGERTL
jgi:centrosomal protein CEP104